MTILQEKELQSDFNDQWVDHKDFNELEDVFFTEKFETDIYPSYIFYLCCRERLISIDEKKITRREDKYAFKFCR